MGRRLLLAWYLLCMVPLIAVAAPGRDPFNYFFNDTFGNFADELQTARHEGKQGVLLFFEQADCPFCHYMEQNVLNQPEVQAYYRKHFLSFPVDILGDVAITDFRGRQTTEREFAKVTRVRATPVFAFYDLKGKQIFRYTGSTSGVAEFMLMGRYVVDGTYSKMPFVKYKREQLQ